MNSNIQRLKNVLQDICGKNTPTYIEIINFLKTKNIFENQNIVSINNNNNYLSPRYISQYSEIQQIGTGGFGDVFISQYYLDKKIYAIKKIPIYTLDMDYIQNYISEILILSRLEHKHIVRYYTSWVESYSQIDTTKLINTHLLPDEYSLITDNSFSTSSNSEHNETPILNLYLQMELCKPFNLNDIIPNLSVTESIKIIKQIIQGVKYLHSKCIVHRDIKPKNILFSLENNTLKLADFGLSCLENSNTRMSSSLGTYLYIDPHSVGSTKTADIYSIGVVITEILCKFKTSMERIECLKKLKNCIIPDYIDDNIKKVIKKCIDPNIDTNRYTILELEDVIDTLSTLH